MFRVCAEPSAFGLDAAAEKCLITQTRMCMLLDICWGMENPLLVDDLDGRLRPGWTTAAGRQDHRGSMEACWSSEPEVLGNGASSAVTTDLT